LANFSRTLNFTSANEDGATELAALALRPSDHVLCLTASGARPLDLLLGNPRRVTAIDINPAQNELLRLKIAAWRTLDDRELIEWLGIAPVRNRLALQARAEALLPPASRAFWQVRRSAIVKGLWHSGRWERVLRLGAMGNRLIRGRQIDALFNAADCEAQANIWAAHFDDGLWHGAARLLSLRWFWTRIIGEPGGAYLPDPSESAARLTGLFRRAASRFLFRESDFATLIFKGRLTPGSALPLHLRPENIPTIRERLDRIDIVEAGLADLGRSGLGPFDAFSLSDFGSYCSGSAYEACWQGVLAAARPGARFCERIFMNPVLPGPDIAAQVRIDADRSEALTRADRAIIYDIRCGTLAPGQARSGFN
jgi:S-adenosylmethionine-diacylglycerol 3-amino-3-carboxypropyl transferase